MNNEDCMQWNAKLLINNGVNGEIIEGAIDAYRKAWEDVENNNKEDKK